MNYLESLEYLDELSTFGTKLGLGRIKQLVTYLDNPQTRYKTIHITGTNGKGSTSSMLSSILTTSNIKTGLYISPHLVSYTERIQIDGNPISEEDFADCISAVKTFVDKMVEDGEESPTQFEVITAAAFLYFAINKVEYAVIEVGLGGLLDSTNVVKPEVSVITNVAFEHAHLCGGTLEGIKRFAPAIVKAGAVFVDNSSAFRMDPDVPLVIPEINPEDARKHKGIIANPNCTTIVSLVAINALNQDSPIESIIASSYQAVSGAGAGGPIELLNEVERLGQGEPVEPKVFQYQIAYNVIPQIGGEAFEGYTSEEMKMQNEGRKIMHLPELKVSCTCVRVPVVRSHSVSIVVRTREKISVERARQLIAAAPGCRLVDDLANKRYPMPLETSDQDLVFVGRIRDDLTSDNGLNIWCCGDQVRKGAATNCVQIAELLIQNA